MLVITIWMSCLTGLTVSAKDERKVKNMPIGVMINSVFTLLGDIVGTDRENHSKTFSE